jgi:transcriptional regulator with PAS, ATPase and Fis domain
VARNLHLLGPKPELPFVALDCANIPASMAEGYLFGYEKGAFTGADRSQEGILEQANGGTLFLDEVGALPFDLQSRFLRVLQEKEFCRLGSSKMIRVEFRLIAAANQDLEQLTKQGKFKSDLFFRLQGVELSIPPLRERREDIGLLAKHYLPTRELSDGLLEAFYAYSWPGNIRELKSTLLAIDALADDGAVCEIEQLPDSLRRKLVSRRMDEAEDFKQTNKLIEKERLQAVFESYDKNVSRMAKALKLDRSHLHHKLTALGIHKPRKG